MQDHWFDLICFVVILGFVQALLFKINASTGGLDILAKIVNKFTNIDIGTSVTIAGAAICCTAFAINDLRLVIIGLIGTWVNGLIVNHFTSGLNMRKKLCIISKEGDRIKDFIIKELNRGATLYDVRGGSSSENMIEVVSILTKDEFAKLMKFIDDNKIKTFMTASNVSEVYGFWNIQKSKVRK
jgi:uncharacterized membrane-anchored protein YitT (DUF2179 family)